jgi:membrane protein YdbS with pleckstrin-like domain
MSSVNVISWALVLTLPINVLLTYRYFDFELNSVSLSAVISFIYVGLISMYIGFSFGTRESQLEGLLGLVKFNYFNHF